MCLSHTQWLPKPSHHMKDPYAYIECKQVTCGLQTYKQPSEYWTQKGDLSEKTLCHFCTQLCRLALQSHCLTLCCIVKGSRSIGCQADRPCCYKQQGTAQVETGHAANMPISWLMIHDVVVWSWSVLSGVRRRRTFISCMPFSLTCSNPLIPYLHDSE